MPWTDNHVFEQTSLHTKTVHKTKESLDQAVSRSELSILKQ